MTTKDPFPPDDGQKIPVAGLIGAVRAEHSEPRVVLASKPSSPPSARKKLAMFAKRFNPVAGFASLEELPNDGFGPVSAEKHLVVVVSPARLLDLVSGRAKEQNGTVALILNDAKWPMYLEALEYGLGRRRGGNFNDLLKGMFLPIAYLKEMNAYRSADLILVQSEREMKHLHRYRKNIIVAPNAILCPTVCWTGRDSDTLAIQVNFTNRRELKWKPFVTEIWPVVQKQVPELRLELFGPGNEPPDWVEATNGVTFVGRVDDLDAYLASKRALVMPLEHSTGISNTIIRGIAIGIPTVITRHSSYGVKSMVRDSDPIYVAKSTDALAKKTIEAVSTPIETAPRAINDWAENLNAIVEKLRDL